MLFDESLTENLSKLIINANSNAAFLGHLNKEIHRRGSTSSNQQHNQQFDENLFGKIFTAYAQLDKVTQFFDKLNGNLLHAINYQLQQTIIYILMTNKISKENANSNSSESHQTSSSSKDMQSYMEEIKRVDIHDLFKLINTNDYKQAIGDLCLNLWSIMKNFYRICMWIVGNYLTSDEAASKLDPTVVAMIEKKLNSGLYLVWKEVQQRTSQLFRSMCFDNFKFDEFIQILTILNKLAEFGNEFCDNPSFRIHPEIASKILLAAVKDQTLAYFRAIHM
jgi:hypothetical protein